MTGSFREPMTEEIIYERLIVRARHNPIYHIAVEAAGHQGLVVDQLSWKLKKCLPAIISALADEVERENAQAHENPVAPASAQQ